MKTPLAASDMGCSCHAGLFCPRLSVEKQLHGLRRLESLCKVTCGSLRKSSQRECVAWSDERSRLKLHITLSAWFTVLPAYARPLNCQSNAIIFSSAAISNGLGFHILILG